MGPGPRAVLWLDQPDAAVSSALKCVDVDVFGREARSFTMKRQIITSFRRCRHDRPLVVVDGLPGDGAELRPEQLRQLAEILVRTADEADKRPTTGRQYCPGSKAHLWGQP
jgi:hypothetical protein